MMQIVINISDFEYELLKKGKLSEENIRNHILSGIVLPRNHGDLIDRGLVRDYCQRLIDVERKQGTDVMNYGQERVNQTEAIMAHVESEFLCPTVVPAHWEKEIEF